jgi:hypothetical protein
VRDLREGTGRVVLIVGDHLHVVAEFALCPSAWVSSVTDGWLILSECYERRKLDLIRRYENMCRIIQPAVHVFPRGPRNGEEFGRIV